MITTGSWKPREAVGFHSGALGRLGLGFRVYGSGFVGLRAEGLGFRGIMACRVYGS